MKQDVGGTHEVINRGRQTQEVKVTKHKKKTFQNKTGTNQTRNR